MFHNYKIRFLMSAALCAAIVAIFTISDVAGQRQARLGQINKETSPSLQPVFTEFKGVTLGMTAQDVRVKLGEAAQKRDNEDLYLISETVTAQIFYNASHKVMAISVDYMGSTEPPSPRAILGEEAERKPDGSTYKLIRYENKGFWVSYYSSPSSTLVTVTIQQFM